MVSPLERAAIRTLASDGMWQRQIAARLAINRRIAARVCGRMPRRGVRGRQRGRSWTGCRAAGLGAYCCFHECVDSP